MSTRTYSRRALRAGGIPLPRTLPLPLGALLLGSLLLAGCASSGGSARPSSEPARDPAVRRAPGSPPSAADQNEIYRRMGLLVHSGDLPFVGRVGYLAGPSPESTTVVLTLSLPASAISFAREGPQRFEGTYRVDADVLRGTDVAHRFSSEELVRVTSFRETSRADASVVYQEVFHLAPGEYVLALGVRDAGSTRSGVVRRPLQVPRLDGGLSTPLPLLRRGSRLSAAELPPVVADARATYLYGRDSLAPLYVEAYAAADSVPVRLTAYGEGETELWSETVTLTPLGDSAGMAARLVEVPVSRLAIGVTELALARLDVPGGSGGAAADTARVPVFVSFGASLPLASFEEMVGYLRWFTAASRLAALRAAPPERRGEAWGAFLRATDPDPSTAQHEALLAYFDRIAIANERFRGEASQGWLSDRGRVFVALGEPDMVYDNMATTFTQRGQTIAWEYQRFNVRLVFQDVTGFGGWRLMPSLEDDFRSAFAQLHGT